MDPHHLGKLDPDAHQSGKLIRIQMRIKVRSRIRIRIRIKVISRIWIRIRIKVIRWKP